MNGGWKCCHWEQRSPVCLSSEPTQRLRPCESALHLSPHSKQACAALSRTAPPPSHLSSFPSPRNSAANSSLGSSPTAGLCITLICQAGPASLGHFSQEICPYRLPSPGCSLWDSHVPVSYPSVTCVTPWLPRLQSLQTKPSCPHKPTVQKVLLNA